MLCDACNNLLSGRNSELPRQLVPKNSLFARCTTFIHHHNWLSFLEAVSNGCHLCNLVRSQVTRTQIADSEASGGAILYTCSPWYSKASLTFGAVGTGLTNRYEACTIVERKYLMLIALQWFWFRQDGVDGALRIGSGPKFVLSITYAAE